MLGTLLNSSADSGVTLLGTVFAIVGVLFKAVYLVVSNICAHYIVVRYYNKQINHT